MEQPQRVEQPLRLVLLEQVQQQELALPPLALVPLRQEARLPQAEPLLVPLALVQLRERAVLQQQAQVPVLLVR